MNGSELEAIRSVLRAELKQAIAELELRLTAQYVTKAAVEPDIACLHRGVENLNNWRSFTRGAMAALSVLATSGLAVAGFALKLALG